jgi:putative redox protein
MAILSQIIYKGDLRTEAEHLASGVKIITDAPTDNHGKGQAFSPSDLVSTALAQRMITLMGIAANNHQIKLEKIEAEVTKTMGTDPRRITIIKVDFKIEDLNYTVKEKTILERAALTCPVAKSLSPDVHQDITFSYY